MCQSNNWLNILKIYTSSLKSRKYSWTISKTSSSIFIRSRRWRNRSLNTINNSLTSSRSMKREMKKRKPIPWQLKVVIRMSLPMLNSSAVIPKHTLKINLMILRKSCKIHLFILETGSREKWWTLSVWCKLSVKRSHVTFENRSQSRSWLRTAN